MIDWNAVDTVLLDMDGTLLDLHYDNYFWLTHLPQRYAEFHDLDPLHAHRELSQLIASFEGTLQWYCLDHWSALVRMDIPALKREIQHKIRTRPHTEVFLRFLRQSRKKVILATNAHRTGLTLKLEVSRIDRWLDLVISSHDYQHPKEATAFWHCLAEAESIDPQRTLFIDDNLSVLRAARSFGLHQLVCINQPDSQKPPQVSGEFIDIIDFDEIMPTGFTLQDLQHAIP
jgi:HAD superfamily hydrolase (TIGR01509 family)